MPIDPVTVVSTILALVKVGGEVTALAVDISTILKAKGAISQEQWQQIITEADASDARFDQWLKELNHD